MRNKGRMKHTDSALRRFRETENMSLDQLGAMLGVEKGHLSRIERGLVWPSREFFENLARVTDGRVTANDFVAPADRAPQPEPEAAR